MANSIVDYLHPYKVRLTDMLDPPVISASIVGVTGTSTYNYMASFITLVGQSLCGDPISITNGVSSLTGFNKIQLAVTSVPASVTFVRFWKLVSGVWVIINDVAPDPNNPTYPVQIYDSGQSNTSGILPTVNTSGRPGVLAICPKPGIYNQRINWMDLQAIDLNRNQQLWDTVFKDGDIMHGCVPSRVDGNPWAADTAYTLGTVISIGTVNNFRYKCTVAGTSGSTVPTSLPTSVNSTFTDGGVTWQSICDWVFSDGQIYFLGVPVDILGGEVSITGVGVEKVGVTLSPLYTTPDQDLVQRASIDEGVPPLRASTGPDWIYVQAVWGIGQSGQLDIQSFTDGDLTTTNLTPQRTPWEITIADRFNDVVGDCVVAPFSLEVKNHPTDNTKLMLSIGKGTAYPEGFKTVIPSNNQLSFSKARDTATQNNSSLGVFTATGGSVISSLTETFNLNGTSLKLKVGTGNYHTVNFTLDNNSAQDVANYINLQVNSYPSSGSEPLISCTYGSGKVEIQAARDSLEIATVASDCYSILGITPGVYPAGGIRVYPCNDPFIKDVSDLNYRTSIIEEVTHNGSTQIDAFQNSNLVEILGVSLTEADAYDQKFDYKVGVDFVKAGDTISFANMSGAQPTGGATMYVSYQYRRNGVKGVRQLVRVRDAQVVRDPNSNVDTLTFTGASTITKAIDGSSVSLSGTPSDVTEILQVTTNSGQSSTYYTAYTFLKNSTAISHNPSQISWAAAGEPNSGVGGQPTGSATYYVTFDMWWHSLEGDYVSADSFDDYDYIEFAGGLDLRDCVDFRTTSGNEPVDGEDVVLDYEYYIPRIDKLLLNNNGIFSLIRGIPAPSPTMPTDQDGNMTIGVLKISPYTLDASWVKTVLLAVNVTTQMALQNVITRLDNLEYWKATADLENETANSPAATDATGIFTDALTGFSKLDLQFNTNGMRHTAALDINNQCMLLPTEPPDNRVLAVDIAHSTNIIQVGNTLMLDFVPELFMEQPYATESVNCASDFTITDYRGTVTLNPASDCFVDSSQLPAINVDFDNNLQPLVDALVSQGALSLSQTVWDSWNYSFTTGDTPSSCYGNWIAAPFNNVSVFGTGTVSSLSTDANGNSVYSTTPGYTDPITGATFSTLEEAENDYVQARVAQSGGRALVRGYTTSRGWGDASGMVTENAWRDGVTTSLVPGVTTQDLGSSVVNLAMSGRVRTTNSDGSPFMIHVDVTSLMPNQDHCVTMGGIAANFTYDSSGNPAKGSSGSLIYQSCSTVKSDNDGRLTGEFQVPAGLSAGSIPVAVFQPNFPANSNAVGYFNSAGFTEQSRDTTVGMPTFNTITTPLNESSTTTIYGNYYDPLAQTFTIPGEITYFCQVGVFFRTKSATLPIRLEVRSVTNGEPGSVVLATAVMEAADCVISEDGTAETVFELDAVVGYAANTDYSIILFPSLNNTDYAVWTAKVGDVDVSTQTLVSVPPNGGVLFSSPNAKVWEPIQKQYLKMRLYESNFRDNCAIVFEHISGVSAALFVAKVQEFLGAGTNSSWYYSVDNEASWISFYPNLDTSLGQIISEVDLRLDVTSLGGSYQMISPIAGIVFLLHQLNADAIFLDQFFQDSLSYPNQVKAYLDIDAYGVNGAGITSITPYFTYNDGETWVEIPVDSSYSPNVQKTPFYRYLFSTVNEVSVGSASNASPIVITSEAHGFTENMLVDVSSVGGNTSANGTWVAKSVTVDTFALYTQDGTASTGNAAYTTGGIVKGSPISQLRPRVNFTTSNAALTPRIMNVSFISTRL